MNDRSAPWLAFRTTKGTAETVARILRGAVHLHNAEYVPAKGTSFFVANAATELELLLLPHAIQQFTGKDVWTLMPPRLAQSHAGKLIEGAGAIMTTHPDPDKIIRSLLQGTHAWVAIEDAPWEQGGARAGTFDAFRRIWGGSNGAPAVSVPSIVAGLAARAEAYRQLLQRNVLSQSITPPSSEAVPDGTTADDILCRLKIDSPKNVTDRQVLLVPLKVNYFPFPERLNGLLPVEPAETPAAPPAAASAVAAKPEQASVVPEIDIDIVFGKPLAMGDCFGQTAGAASNRPPTDEDIRKAAHRATAYCAKLDMPLTALNINHILTGIVAKSWFAPPSTRLVRHRVFLAAMELAGAGDCPIHSHLDEAAHRVAREEPVPAFDGMLEQIMQANAGKISRTVLPGRWLHHLPEEHLARALLHELKSLPEAERTVARIAWTPQAMVSRRVRQCLMDEEKQAFRQDYETHFQEGVSKEPDVGAPFLLKPAWPVGAVVLIHGYMAAPLEVRALAEYLYQRQYAVFGVRLKGHGTSPTDLAAVTWEDWYQSIRRGYAIARAISDDVIIGGFSMGAGLALLTAGRLGDAVKGVFAINAPLYLQNSAARFAPSIVRVNALLRHLHVAKPTWEYLENDPENKHINYTSNPVKGVAQLNGAMTAMEGALKDITCPALVLQGSRDPVVNAESGPAIFEKIGNPYKELVVLERNNHGIINGERSREVFDRIYQFLTGARGRKGDY